MTKILMGSIISRKSFPHKPIRDMIDIFGLEKLYVFKIKNAESSFFLAFNLDKSDIDPYLKQAKERYSSIFRVNRKAKHKAYFTIAALEKLPKDFSWRDYENSLLVVNKEKKLRKFDLELLKILNL